MTPAIDRATLSRLSPADAAALWQVTHDSGALVEAGLFDEWLVESEANARAWSALQDIWSVFDDADDATFGDLRAAALSAGPAPRVAWRSFAAVAAVVATIGGGAVMLPRTVAPPHGETPGTAYAAIDAVRTVALADGSRMTLDMGSRVRVAFEPRRRRVILDRGRALFAVRHDGASPFVVATRDRTIIDLGTRFEVGLTATTTQVALFEGSVRVDGGRDGATLLRPGQTLVASTGGVDRVSSAEQAPEALWREGLVQLDNVTLADAAERMNVGSAVTLTVDPKVMGLHVSGRFRLRDAARFARAVAEILPVRVVRVAPGRIELRQRR